ncbi:hypothetical protein D3C76_1798690 [compost metagenome]
MHGLSPGRSRDLRQCGQRLVVTAIGVQIQRLGVTRLGIAGLTLHQLAEGVISRAGLPKRLLGLG